MQQVLKEHQYSGISNRHKMRIIFIVFSLMSCLNIYGTNINHDRMVYDSLYVSKDLSLLLYSSYERIGDSIIFDSIRRFLYVQTCDYNYKYDNIFDGNIQNIEYLQKISKRSFLISKESGQGCKFCYSLHVIYKDNRLILKKIQMKSKCPSRRKKRKSIVLNIPLENYKPEMIDYYKEKYHL